MLYMRGDDASPCVLKLLMANITFIEYESDFFGKCLYKLKSITHCWPSIDIVNENIFYL